MTVLGIEEGLDLRFGLFRRRRKSQSQRCLDPTDLRERMGEQAIIGDEHPGLIARGSVACQHVRGPKQKRSVQRHAVAGLQ